MNRSKLVEALTAVKPCVQLNTLVPIMSHFCFKDGKIFTYNGTEGMVIDFDTELNCCVQSDLFMKILNNSKEEINFKLEEDILVIDNGRVEIQTLPTSDWVFEFPTETQHLIDLSEDVITGINKCAIFSSKLSTMESLYGITFQSDSDLESLNLFASDNTRIAAFSVDKTLDDEINMVVPLPFCKMLGKLYRSFGEGTLSLGTDDTVIAKFGDLKVFTTIPTDIKIMDYAAVINPFIGQGDNGVEVTKELKNAVDTVLVVLGSYKDKQVNIERHFDDDKTLVLLAEGALAACTECVDYEQKLPDIKCKIDATIFEEFIDSVDYFCKAMDGNKTLFFGTKDNFFAMMESL